MTAYTTTLTSSSLRFVGGTALYPGPAIYPGPDQWPNPGTLIFTAARSTTGSFRPAGTVAGTSAHTQALAATLHPVAAFTKQTARALTAAALTMVGSLAKQQSVHVFAKTLTGVLVCAGSLQTGYIPEFLSHPSSGGGGVWFHDPFERGAFRVKTPRGVR